MSGDEDFWERYHLENDKPYMFESTLSNLINNLNPASVLEIGCGLGNNLAHLKAKKITGIDISEHAIKIARQRFPQYTFHVGSVLQIPLKETFDIVFTSTVIEHVKPNLLPKAFEEMFRVSSKYILNIEAYDRTEHMIDWHRGKNEFWTVHVAQRWKKFPVSIIQEYDLNDEYRLTLVAKNQTANSPP
ncbi:MAG: class I SAM-dependent methyltransferase [Candidatus Nitrosotenuis sp.]